MGTGIEILTHEAIVFNLRRSGADCLLEQHTTCVLFIGKQFIDCFSVPFELAGRGEDSLFLQASGYLAETVTIQVSLEDPTDGFGFRRVND